ncbi:MAG: ATP-dependent helicase HrpB [Geminicoccaceae bacterium]
MPPPIHLPPTGLPIEAVLPELAQALAHAPAAVLEAPPGAGKTTLVPLRLADAPWLAGQRILMLEPRRLATRAAARRMAELLGEEVGGTVGYAMRFERKRSAATRIEVVTEGLLTRRLQRDPALEGYGLVIFDEFHERSLDADLALALCLDAQAALRPELRLLVMSATLDGAGLAEHLGGVPRVRSAGRAFPVRVEHLPPQAGERLERTVARAVQHALAVVPDSILVFLPGAAEIRRAQALLAGCGATVHALYGELGRAEQEAALRPAPAGRRKVVLATNIAETSLTIEGIGVVIDAGLERRPQFSPRSGMSRLVTLPIGRASAEQRRGRAGRLGPGLCLRLWSAEEERGRAERRPPEIEAADLAPLALELAAWGARDASQLRFPTPPPAGALAQARTLLGELAALDGTGAVTPLGRRMAELPLHPRLAFMVLRAKEHGLLPTALAVAALLGGRLPDREPDLARQVERLQARDPELREVARVQAQLARLLEAGDGEAMPDAVGAVVGLAFPDRLAQARPGTRGSFRLANGRGARLDPHEPLAQAAWLAVAEIEDGSEGRIRLAAATDLATLERLQGERFGWAEAVAWDAREQVVQARRELRLGSLLIREQALAAPEPELVAAAMCAGIRAKGLHVLPWTGAAERWRCRVAFLARLEPGRWPAMGEAALLADLERWLGPWLHGRRRLAELRDLDLAAILAQGLDPAQRRELDRRAPPSVTVPTGRQVAIDYAADPPALAVKLQELFGLAATPAVDEGRVPLSLQLLSPAQRPIAVTRDLAAFWAGGYAAVRKEMRGRYPKHPWPEDPLAAPPTARAKPPGLK